MAVPVLAPKQQTSAIILPPTGTFVNVTGNLPIGVYSNSVDFVSGAVDQVAYTYKMIGGDVLDIEMSPGTKEKARKQAIAISLKKKRQSFRAGKSESNLDIFGYFSRCFFN